MFRKKKMKTLIYVLVLFSFALSQTITIKHKLYTTTFDTIKHYPVLVEWWDYQSLLSCSSRLKRSNIFSQDPLAPSQTDLSKDYTYSGYDRGHNMPAFDNECNHDALSECFYFSNMTPQTPSLNRGDWKDLETYTRQMVQQYDSIKIWCGSCDSINKIGRLTIPKTCWKVIYIKKINKYEAFIFSNDKTKKSLDLHRTTVDSITYLTKFNFTEAK